MLGDLTQSYAALSPPDHAAMDYLLVHVGAVLGWFQFAGTQLRLGRARYILWLLLLGLALTANQVWWVVYMPAVQAGMIDKLSLPVFDMASYLALGACMTLLAIARSRDAFGRRRFAILAFVPVFSFVLLLIPSQRARAK